MILNRYEKKLYPLKKFWQLQLCPYWSDHKRQAKRDKVNDPNITEHIAM